MADLNPLYDPSTDNASISNDMQSRLNQPLGGASMSTEDDAFLKFILAKIEDKTIQLYSPSSLLNMPVYEKLSPIDQGKADQNALVLLTRVRELYQLTQVSMEPTYQLINLVQSLRLIKSRMEEQGDIFII